MSNGIAIYAAVASTVALIWDVIKWRKGQNPHLRVNVTPGMVMIDGYGKSSESKIVFTVTNVGGLTTTIKNITGHWYKNYFDFMRKRIEVSFVVANPYLTQKIPYELKTGQEWIGGMNQDEFTKEYQTGYVTFGIHHTLSEKPIEKTLSVSHIIMASKTKTSK